jgi:hypothetical protein
MADGVKRNNACYRIGRLQPNWRWARETNGEEVVAAHLVFAWDANSDDWSAYSLDGYSPACLPK